MVATHETAKMVMMVFDDAMRYRDCGWCGVRDVAMNMIWFGDVSSSRKTYEAWALFSCPRCGGATTVQTFPSNNNAKVVLRTVPEGDTETKIEGVPDDVARYYKEAHIATSAGLTDAAAVELRKTLERAASHFQDSSGNTIGENNERLVERIEKLVEAGHLAPPFKQALDHVRLVGNIGAHAGDEQVSPEALQATLTFATQTLRNLFEIPYLLKQLDEDAEAEPAEAEPAEAEPAEAQPADKG